MNYDHAFHAGNFADVVKHIILARLIAYFRRKPAPFRVIDTHAGSGCYALDGNAAERNPEWRDGIARLMAATLPPDVAELTAPYLAALRDLNPDGALAAYPGSPLLAKKLMRPEDRLTAMELNPAAGAALRGLFAGDQQVKTLLVDGYDVLPAQLPPKQKRALILIDPPFEEPDEFDRMFGVLKAAHRIFAQGVYALWYPLKDETGIKRFKTSLHESGIPDIMFSEFQLRAPSEPSRLFGSGMIVVNPPYVLMEELDRILAVLLPILANSKTARFENGVIRPEKSVGSG
jgi:23S rRNA (adenine2030-N6)-methyltransferase